MSLADSRTQNVERSRETSEVFDSVFRLLMDFANAAETIVPQPERRAVADDDTTDEAYVDKEEPRENEGDGNAGELFHILPGKDKEELVKDVFGKIVANMLDKLPEDGKETFLVKCFHGLFPKLPCESQRVIEIKVTDVLSQTQEAFATPSTPELPSASTNRISAGDLRPVTIRVNYPPAVGGGGGGGGQGRGGGGGGQGRGRGGGSG